MHRDDRLLRYRRHYWHNSGTRCSHNWFWWLRRLVAQPRFAASTSTIDNDNAKRYYRDVIHGFADKDTEKVWRREVVKRFAAELQRVAHRKLLMLDAAEMLSDLRIPPGNRLEALRGSRQGQHSIRVNDQ